MVVSIAKKYNKTGLGNIVLPNAISDYIYNANRGKYKSLIAIKYYIFTILINIFYSVRVLLSCWWGIAIK
ncbi:hypothetical protein AYY19_07970 [Photobacterium aquimaris]|uniref:Uncharacterized protein n=1 Tax=Photobacterium aquimaris TaxID=512643 RepID=A0A2T3ILF1_9GAMM|nr:hypothetical protein AYY19_07970 [Photobacterium aquimaris]OBU22416.1 hypothetical protein AYY20_11495 [Photobacterium aquimaris]PSU29165.1 hypothetical protein CTM88_09135 [Photobacterium aquimaris]PSW00772.1 hypothetical protein CTM91_10950 [Photobacterium aquimaris]